MKYLTWTIVALLIGDLALNIWNSQRVPRVAYVRSQELIYGYFGMKEAMTDFQGKQTGWQNNLDTLKADLQRTVAEARNLQANKAAAQETLREKAQMIDRQQQDLLRYQDAVQKKSAEEEKRILGGVLAQVNAFVERYAKEKGYDVVLGTTDAGSLLYGNGTLDITDDLLTALNRDHEGGGE